MLTKEINVLKDCGLNHPENIYIAVLFPCIEFAGFALTLSVCFFLKEMDICLESMHYN